MSIFGVTKDTKLEEQVDKNRNGEEQGAGMYAVLNGNTNQDIFNVLKKVAPIEKNAVDQLHQFAKHLRDFGLEEAAKQIDTTAMDEGNHGEILVNIIEKFRNI